MIDVAAALLYDEKKRILICRRAPAGDCAGLWEFPGGKRENGETMEQCVVRECREELNAEIELDGVYSEFCYAYPSREIHFVFFKAKLLSLHLTLNVHTEIEWVEPRNLRNYAFCPADEKLIERLSQEA